MSSASSSAGSCGDLDGDGEDDLFLPTGTAWWHMSAAKPHWVVLGSRRNRLDQLGLGDFDGDGRCDVFSVNASNDTWEIASGRSGSRLVLPESYPLIAIDQLRFGDFNGDHVTDVFRRAPDGHWSAISPGRYDWTPLQSSALPITELRFGDLIRYVPTNPTTGRWDISSGGRTGWQALATYTGPVRPTATMPWPSASVRTFLGRFDAWAKADVLAIDAARTGRLFSVGHSNFAQHGLYAY